MLKEITPQLLFSSFKQFPDIELSVSRPNDWKLKVIPPDHRSIALFCGRCGSYKTIIQNCGSRQCEYCRSRIVYRTLSRKKLTDVRLKELRFLTLTIKSVPVISHDFIITCRGYLKKLMKQPWWIANVKGGLYVIEITQSLNGYHVHFHIIYEGNYLPYYWIRFAWKQITGNSFVIWINKIKNLKATLDYCLNYISKIDKSNVDPELYRSCLKKVKFICFFGSWYKLKSIKIKAKCVHCDSDIWYSEYDVLYGHWSTDDS